MAGFAEIRRQEVRRAAVGGVGGVVAVDDDDEAPVLTLLLFFQHLLAGIELALGNFNNFVDIYFLWYRLCNWYMHIYIHTHIVIAAESIQNNKI